MMKHLRLRAAAASPMADNGLYLEMILSRYQGNLREINELQESRKSKMNSSVKVT